MGCFSGCLMSAASDQKLFCKLCSPFCCSFDEFVEEKVISPSYSSAISTPPPVFLIYIYILVFSKSAHLGKKMLSYLLKLDIITNLFFSVNPSYFIFSSPSLIFSSTPLFSQHIPVPRVSKLHLLKFQCTLTSM